MVKALSVLNMEVPGLSAGTDFAPSNLAVMVFIRVLCS